MATKTKMVHVSEERMRVQSLIARAQATEAALSAAEYAMDNLNDHAVNFTK